MVANSALEVYADGKVIPGPMGGPSYGMASDSGRHYWDLSDNIYRFSPIELTRAGISMWHGMDEKISVENYNQVETFFTMFEYRKITHFRNLIHHLTYCIFYSILSLGGGILS